MADTRLPQVGGDSGNWGGILNTYLSVSHDDDGALKGGVVTTTAIADGAITNAKIANNVSIDQSKISGLTEALDAKASVSSVNSLQSQVAEIPNFTVSATAPTSPAVNDIWIDIS